MDDALILSDPVEYSAMLVRLLTAAHTSVFYSSFIAHLDVPLPGQGGVTLGALFADLCGRGVALHILYNTETAYGNLPAPEFAARLPGAMVHAVTGSGLLPVVASWFVPNTTYSNHHQKYVCVDDAHFMLGGTDVTADRSGWLQPNVHGYSWHEVAVVVRVTPSIAAFVRANFVCIVQLPPFPLTKGWQEHELLCRLITTATACVHMEAQACISGATTANRVFDALLQRLAQAHRTTASGGEPDWFRFMLFTNMEQRDESGWVSWVSSHELHWSRRFLYREAKALGMSREFVDSRVFIGHMVHGTTHVKVHSNLVIQDGQRLLRSSSNLTDRSMCARPCDNELGIVVTGEVVAEFQQHLWRRYLLPGRSEAETAARYFTPEQAFESMCLEQGLARRVQFRAQADSPLCPDTVVNPVMDVLHMGAWFGGREEITWSVSRA